MEVYTKKFGTTIRHYVRASDFERSEYLQKNPGAKAKRPIGADVPCPLSPATMQLMFRKLEQMLELPREEQQAYAENLKDFYFECLRIENENEVEA